LSGRWPVHSRPFSSLSLASAPAGLVWCQGKGGEIILTPVGRTIVSVIIVIGGFAGALCGLFGIFLIPSGDVAAVYDGVVASVGSGP